MAARGHIFAVEEFSTDAVQRNRIFHDKGRMDQHMGA